MNKLGFKQLIILLIIVSGLLPLIVVSYYTIFKVGNELTHETFNKNKMALHTYKKGVEDQFSEIENQVELTIKILALDAQLDSLKSQRDLSSWQTEQSALNITLATLSSTLKALNVVLVDSSLTIVASSKESYIGSDLSSRKYLKKAISSKKPVYSEPFYSDVALRNMITYARPIYFQGALVGAFVFGIDFDEVSQYIQSGITEFGTSQNVYMVDGTGLLLTDTKSGYFNDGGAFTDTLSTQATKDIANSIRSNNIDYANTDIYLDYRGISVIGSYSFLDIGNLPIGLVVEVDESLAMAALHEMQTTLIITILIVLLCSGIAALVIISRILSPIHSLNSTFDDIATGEIDVDYRLDIQTHDEIGQLGLSFNQFMGKLKLMIEEFNFQNQVKTARNELNELFRDKDDYHLLSKETLSYLCKFLDIQMGALYLREGNDLSLTATYAYSNRKGLINKVKPGEGLVGQCMIEKEAFIINNTPDDYLTIQSGLGEAKPRNIAVIPCIYEGEVLAVLEFASLNQIEESQLALINKISATLATAVNSTKMHSDMRILLEKTTLQAEEMTVQQEELSKINTELEQQTADLRDSEQKLQVQQEELRVTNEELEERTHLLEQQKRDIDNKNNVLVQKQTEIIEKAQALEQSNRYKSEFLANMSHELRTPLNSIIVLSQLLAAKKDLTPLSQKESEFAETIHSSGSDLLNIINDILDLSKVEAGHLNVNIEDVTLASIVKECERMFVPLAEMKHIQFKTDVSKEVTACIESDKDRIKQILKNLISNAIKFTANGEVRLQIRDINNEEKLRLQGIDHSAFIAIEVSDTGPGIASDKLDIIFEAFKQEDGTTSRTHGGTGLGLTISRELAGLLGGEITVSSEVSKGSSFTLLLPEKSKDTLLDTKIALPSKSFATKAPSEKSFPEKNHLSKEKNNRLLIIEDDINFAKTLRELSTNQGYESKIAHRGQDALELAKEFRPSVILLDLGLPDMDGDQVATALQEMEQTKNALIHIISGQDNVNEENLPDNVIGFLKKPVDIKTIYQTLATIENNVKDNAQTLLVVGECGQESFDNFSKLGQLEVIKVLSIADAIEQISEESVGCMVIDKSLELTEYKNFVRLSEDYTHIPIIIYSDHALSHSEKISNKNSSESILKNKAKNMDRLKDEIALFLHQLANEDLIEGEQIDQHLNLLAGKHFLVVDDDDRNIFALKSLLETYDVKVSIAENGQESIDFFNEANTVDLVLMDIMMPKVDGYEAIQKIRQIPDCKELPIIVLTAKAMQNERVKCLQIGANDYITKPIDTEKLLAVLKVWLA